MTALDAFLYGMPFVLMAGAGVTLWFARRAAREIRSHEAPHPSLKRILPSNGEATARPKADVAA